MKIALVALLVVGCLIVGCTYPTDYAGKELKVGDWVKHRPSGMIGVVIEAITNSNEIKVNFENKLEAKFDSRLFEKCDPPGV